MKILLLNAVDNSGGAARAAQRLCCSLIDSGVDAEMLVQRKVGTASYVKGPSSGFRLFLAQMRAFLDTVPLHVYRRRNRYIFSPSCLPERLAEKVRAASPDLIHLHWLCEGFVQVESLARFEKPLIWTLHDSWPFTGGCHVPFDCNRYEGECGRCPSLGSDSPHDLSHWIWKRKQAIFPLLNLTVVAPSRRMAERAMASSLLRDKRVEVIPNGIDVDRFHPMAKDEARAALSLPQNGKLVLFNGLGGYDDINKGFSSLTAVLALLREQGMAVDLVVVGQDKAPPSPNAGIHILGRVETEEKMAMVYSAADVTLIPSLEENLCFTAMESMACGTPCVAFRVGGNSDIVEHGVTGFLAEPGDIRHFVSCLQDILDSDRRREMSANGRKRICSFFSLPQVTDRYLSLYRELL